MSSAPSSRPPSSRFLEIMAYMPLRQAKGNLPIESRRARKRKQRTAQLSPLGADLAADYHVVSGVLPGFDPTPASSTLAIAFDSHASPA